MEKFIFYFIAMVMVVFSIMAVSSRNIMRSIIYLLFVLLGIAGIYFMLNFYFLGAVQMTVYAGGVIILYINSIMLVEKIGEPMDAPKLLHQLIAGGISALGIGAGVFAFSNYSFTIAAEESTTTINDVGTAMLSYGENGFILPFEVVSMLLLAVMVGAIVIAKSYHQKENTK